jgi:Zn-dependent M16 (insulinase) family peptidase
LVFSPLEEKTESSPVRGNPAAAAGREKLSITGVVYNEMKGAYSSLDAYAALWAVKAVLPGTPYDFESGGDPEHIPELTWKGLREFHRSRYSPGNCRIFLAGNIPTEKQLAFLNERFLSTLPPGRAAPPVARAKPWKEPRSFAVPCPEGGGEKNTVVLSWLCGDTADAVEALSLAALTETLLGHDGSPLTRALIDSGLGEDLSPVTGLEGELRETVFTAGLRGVEGREKDVEELIFKELKGLAEKGIPKTEIETALLAMEFSHREIRRSGGPFSLVWMRRSLKGWFYGGKPWDSLLFAPAFGEIKKRLAADPSYFEGMIRRYLLDNPHWALIVIKPEKGFLEKKEAGLARLLQEKEAALSNEEKQRIREQSEELARVQEKEDSPKALAAIPHLARQDLSRDIIKVPREFYDAKGAPALAHPLFTNGITYVDLAFPVDTLDSTDYPWLPFFSRAVVSVGLPGMDYGEVSSLLAHNAGGFYAVLQSGSTIPGASRTAAFPSGTLDIRGRDWLLYHLKALDEKTAPSLELALRLITEADFGDLKRIRDLALEMKNDIDSSLAPSGHSYATGRSGRNFSRSRLIDEIWNGLDQLFFVHRLADMDAREISARLVSIRDKLLKAGLLVNLCCGDTAVGAALGETGACFGAFGVPRPRNAALADPALFSLPAGYGAGPARFPEVFASPSLQISFASFTLPAAPYGSPQAMPDDIYAHQLSTGALWESIRMKGGAYGAFAGANSREGTFSFSTYRDPNPLRSLEVFSSVLKELAEQDPCSGGQKDALDKAVIGCYSRIIRPQTSFEKSLSDLFRFLSGIEDRHRSAQLKSLLEVTEDELAAVRKRLAAAAEDSGYSLHKVIITGKAGAGKIAGQLGTEVTELPT